MKKGRIIGIILMVMAMFAFTITSSVLVKTNNDISVIRDDTVTIIPKNDIQLDKKTKDEAVTTIPDSLFDVEKDANIISTMDNSYITDPRFMTVEERLDKGEILEMFIKFDEPWKCHEDLYNQKMYDGTSLKKIRNDLNLLEDELNALYQKNRESKLDEIEEKELLSLRELLDSTQGYYNNALTDFTQKVVEIETKWLNDFGINASRCCCEIRINVGKHDMERLKHVDRGYTIYMITNE